MGAYLARIQEIQGMILVKLPILLVGHSKKTTMGKAGMVMVSIYALVTLMCI